MQPSAVTKDQSAGEPPTELTSTDRELVSTVRGRELYAQHCAACHGDRGDGNGLAASFLYPKPRNFRAGKFRLVSTTNGVPTVADLDAVLVRGMPGSTMPPWAHLSQADRMALVAEVVRLRGEGARDEITRVLIEEEELDEEEMADPEVQDEIENFVDERTKPGAITEVPEIGQPDAEAIARGKVIYFRQSCHSCHGDEGKGNGQDKMVDDEGLPTRPRDFTRGIFKGGYDAASLYRRTAYGMPGTPMPSSAKVTSDEIVDLVHFIQSLSDEDTREAATLNRERLVAKRVDKVPADAHSRKWASVSAVGLRMTPLWWRDDADSDLTVKAVHDGRAIAFRLSWRDKTLDRDAARTEAFKDAIALELYCGHAEPFLGMGSAKSPVDVWSWDADRQGPPVVEEQEYPNMVVDIYPFRETSVATAEYDRPGTKMSEQPKVSLPALASGNLIVPGESKSGGSTLTASGPATMTFRMPQNQLVSARGAWADGRWTVVMSRQLTVESPKEGVSLEPGGRASVAFAIWDGSQRDRDGKKLITIWQDLVLEENER